VLSAFLTATTALLVKGVMLLVSYVANNTFPQPLSPEEEEKQLELLAQNDERAKNCLIEHNLRLVAHIVKKFDGVGEDADDLISIGTIGLIKAINTFDKSKGVRLATYAARCIENEILMHLRTMKKCRLEVSLQDTIGVDKEGKEITLTDVLGTESDAILDLVETKIEFKRLYQHMKKLDRREKEVLELRFGLRDGVRKTQKEIARILGISRSYVSRIEKKAIEKLSRENAI